MRRPIKTFQQVSQTPKWWIHLFDILNSIDGIAYSSPFHPATQYIAHSILANQHSMNSFQRIQPYLELTSTICHTLWTPLHPKYPAILMQQNVNLDPTSCGQKIVLLSSKNGWILWREFFGCWLASMEWTMYYVVLHADSKLPATCTLNNSIQSIQPHPELTSTICHRKLGHAEWDWLSVA